MIHKDLLCAPEISSWHCVLAKLMTSASSAEFPRLLQDVFHDVLPFDTILVSTYKQGCAPILIYDNYPPERRQQGVERYIGDAYILDPFYTSTQQRCRPGVYRLSELAPDCFEDSEYYKHYYGALGLKDEIGIFIQLPGDIVMVFSLGLHETSLPLTRKSLLALKNLQPIIEPLAREYWKWQGVSFVDRLEHHEPVEAAFDSFGDGLLTQREQDIVKLLLAGHSTKSAARELAISDGTVKVHRKHIYQRLAVSSQAQMFRLFLDHVSLVSRQSEALTQVGP